MNKRKIYTSQDIERLSSQGFTQIQIDKYDTVTGTAQETAKQLGVALSFSSRRTAEAKTRPLPSTRSGDITLKGLQLRIFIDSADVPEIRKAVKSGVVAGLAMNPSKVAQAKRPLSEIISEIRKFFDGPISVQGIAEKADDIIQEAQRLSKLSHDLVIKVPVNIEGIKAVKTLVPLGVKTNATLIFSPTQALLAGLANSPFISPFVGRTDDIGYDGIEIIRQIKSLFQQYDIPTKIIAASIKNVKQVVDSIIAGADMVAVPPGVFQSMFYHPLTAQGIEGFVSAGKGRI